MNLYVKVTTKVPDLVIDFLEVELASGKTGNLDWNESFINCTEDGFLAEYRGVTFKEKHMDGSLKSLKGLHISGIGLYSELVPRASITIRKMEFENVSGRSLVSRNPFSYVGLVEDYNSRTLLKGSL